MGVGAGRLYLYDVVVKTFTFAISSTDEFLSLRTAVSNVMDWLMFMHTAKYTSWIPGGGVAYRTSGNIFERMGVSTRLLYVGPG